MIQKVNIALIGLGRIGKVHYENISANIPGASLLTISDPLVCPGSIDGVHFISDPFEAICNPAIDAVVICSPTSTHALLVERAITAGKHIFCEKPLDLSLEKIIELTTKAYEAGIKLMVGFNRRFDPDYLQARKSIKSGRIGKPQIIKITNRDPELPAAAFIKNSGGMFMDFTIHDFDMCCFIMDKPVVEVYAKGLVFFDKKMKESGDIDTALTILTFDDSSYAVIDNSRKAVFGYDQRMEVFGNAGMLLVENNAYNNNVIYDRSGIHQAKPFKNFIERYASSYRLEMQAFIDAVLNDKPVAVDGLDAIQAGRIAVAAHKSMNENRPVMLAEIS